MISRRLLLLLGFAILTSPARAADPWHLPGWRARAVVEIPKPSTEAGVDTAGVRILCQGDAKADGSDYRVLDAAGKPVPFQIMFHDAARYSLLSFRAVNPRGRYFVYFGNPTAARPGEEIAADTAPGSGPPKPGKDGWLPRYGFVLQTVQRPEGDNPRTVADLAKLLAGSKAKYGARYQRRVSEGYNPFGPSDYYMSIYRGWVRVPKDGPYQFCTASNEASFSFLDGKELIHWPGRHTEERGARGEVNTQVTLKAGLHYLEYYHEEVTLEQMAFLGWRPSADKGPFAAIPDSFYTEPHAATVTRYEDAKGPLLRFEPVILDSIWPPERDEGQYTRCRFQAGKVPALPVGTSYEWDFGDGLKGPGPEAEHVYLTTRTFAVTLTARGPAGTQTARWPLLVFEIDHVTDQFKEGKPKDYARLARSYDAAKLDAASLRELASLFVESGDYADALKVGKAFVARFGRSEPLLLARMHRLMGDSAARLGKGGLAGAVKDYEAALVKELPAAERLDVLARLIRVVGIDRNTPEKIAPYVADVEKIARDAKTDRLTRAAYRRAVLATADALLWQGKREGSRPLYAQAERLSGKIIPPQVKAARLGAYPNSLREYLAANNYDAALELIDRWEETFPTEKPNGHTLYWRGKVLALRGSHAEAVPYLERGVRLTVGASFETEARWLLALSLEKLGRKAEARRELKKLVATGLRDDFSKRAAAELKKGS